MNYIELINRYWQEVDIKGWTPVETEIYFRLLDYCNRTGWKNPFILPNPRAVALMAVTENTLAAGRDRLVMKGLIGFRKGSRRKDAPMYCFPEKIEGEWVFPDGFVPCFASNIEPKSGVKLVAKSRVKPAVYNKTKTEKISPDGDSTRTSEEQSLFAEEEKKSRKRKSVKTSKPPEPLSPTLEEVKAYFLSRRADERLENWEREAEVFFNHFSSLGWKTSAGAKITHWDSRANLWILEHEKPSKTDKPIKDETDEADRFSERRGTDSSAKSRKGFKGAF